MKRILFLPVLLIFFVIFFFINSSAFAQTTITVYNNTGASVTSVYIAPTATTEWSSNLSIKNKLLSGESFTFTQITDKNNCRYDVKFMDANAKDYYIHNLDLCNSSVIKLTTKK
jgi:hypothetical protein